MGKATSSLASLHLLPRLKIGHEQTSLLAVIIACAQSVDTSAISLFTPVERQTDIRQAAALVCQ
jgi:hypothetical protein